MWSGRWLKSPSCGQPSWVCSLVFFVQDLFLLVFIRLFVQSRSDRSFFRVAPV